MRCREMSKQSAALLGSSCPPAAASSLSMLCLFHLSTRSTLCSAASWARPCTTAPILSSPELSPIFAFWPWFPSLLS